LVQSVAEGSMASWTKSSRCRGSALGDLDVGASTGSWGEVGVAVLLLGVATRKRTALWPCQSSR